MYHIGNQKHVDGPKVTIIWEVIGHAQTLATVISEYVSVLT